MLQTHRSEHLKRAFLDRFGEIGNVRAVCRELGIGRTTVYEWRAADTEFEQGWKQAEQEAIEVLEMEARRRAVEGVERVTRSYYRGRVVDEFVETKYSDTLLIFLLKGLAPEKYRDRWDVRHSGGLELKDLGALLQQREERTIENTRVSPALPEPSHTIENVDTEEPFYGESELEEADDDA